MVAVIVRKHLRIVTCVLAPLALIMASAPGCSSGASQRDYTNAYVLGLEAYTYGLPLLATNKTFLSMTSIDVSKGTGFGPVNQFSHVRTLNNPGSTAVVAPGANGLSSIAWLDLTREPMVLQVPQVTDHFFVLALLDPYTEDIRNLGSAHDTPPGSYVICGPGQHEVSIPPGAQRIDVNYTRVWIIGSTQLKGESDLANVNNIQDGYTLTPLSKYGSGLQPEPPANPNTTVKVYKLPTGLQFFDVLGQLLEQFPPPAADQDTLRAFATVGIGPGRMPSQEFHLSADTLRGLQDAVAAGPAQIRNDAQAMFLASSKIHNGYWLGGFGRYGTNYQLRAVVAQMGLGAFTSDQTIYAMTLTDYTLQPLTGSSEYVLHMAVAPPANEGWSLTVYDLHGALVPNPINRYQFSNASSLAYNADGSVDIYLQANQPSDQGQVENWLPTPSGAGFEVVWRLLAPKPSAIDGILDGSGWQPPAMTRVR
jgi:hypothetical protein